MSREALLVLGMHRSGTSAVAGVLAHLGAQAPKTLLPADADNPAGYWESTVLCEFHERLLRAAATRWDACTAIEMHRLCSSTNLEGSIDECCRLLDVEFGSASRLVIKDPRMCRFVPFWLHVLERRHIDAVAVLVLRNPLDVALSLAVRNGFERELSLLLWLRHVLDSERETRLVPRTFVRYQELVDDWRSVASRISLQLGLSWPARTAAEQSALHSFVDSGLRHHREEVKTLDDIPQTLGDWLRRAYSALLRMHDQPSAREGLAELDAVRSEFDRAISAVGMVEERTRGRLETQVASLKEQVAKLVIEVGVAEDRAASLRTLVEYSETEKHVLHEHAAKLEALRTDLQERISFLEQNRVDLQSELSAARGDAKALRESASWRITAPLRAAYKLLK